METERLEVVPPRTRSGRSGTLLPEVDTFLHLLVLLFLIDNSEIEKVRVIIAVKSKLSISRI